VADVPPPAPRPPIATEPKPPSPVHPEPPLPSQELAFELLPLAGLGLTGEQAALGFFGEALAGLRWRQYAALQLGLGGGSLGGGRHVLLASAVPQFRPLPVGLPVDVSIGVPLGYVNYAHKAFELVDGQPEVTNATENGFHVGALLAVMVEASEALAFGPVFQFDRLFAERGGSFFCVALAGRYTHWLESDGL
jgi:hypothetical protein